MSSIIVISGRDADKMLDALGRIEQKLDAATLQLGAQYMALADDFDAANARTDAALNSVSTSLTGIAADLRFLKESVPAGPLNQAQGEALKTRMEAIASKAEAAAAALAALDAETTPSEPSV